MKIQVISHANETLISISAKNAPLTIYLLKLPKKKFLDRNTVN